MLKSKSRDLPDCPCSNPPNIIRPSAPTPNHSLYLSNLDDQKFLRFSIKYFYLFRKSVSFDALKLSLSRVLVDYYPLAGRLRASDEDQGKLHVDCNAEGALFVEAFMPITADELLESSNMPNKSWRKLLFKVEAQSLLDVPPLIVQVTGLRCGGMAVCTAINHCICDGLGTSQFLNAWAHLTTSPNGDLPILPFHSRNILKPRNPPQVKFSHSGYTKTNSSSSSSSQVDLVKLLQSQTLVATCFTFTSSHLLHLKKQCVVKCTTFEALASHTWRSWVRSLDLSPALNVKLLFSVNVRKKLSPEIPQGYYGNGFVLGCVESTVEELLETGLCNGVKLVQQEKARLDDGQVRSMIDLLEDKTVKTDLSASLVISQWSKLGLEELDFGGGKALQMGPLTSDIYCLFLPVVGDSDAARVMVSVPEGVVEKFEFYMKEYIWDKEGNGHVHNGYHLLNKMVLSE
ncbi:fatty alcohol:caffeoyl-CoA acyltransferase-like [Neltuma alba]|uniref:fatty alcohol:caffeoyl-CoA acyltransferase-like n=1 Tax=Neltuma alba TaxID=207710 RepID=UPI0010A2BD63|nr:fatty alcohol:caffeoyl-CoA acyltransferase-like [Prosopis alba]